MIRDIKKLKSSLSREEIGREIYDLICELYPIHRSITGKGFRKTMRRIKSHIPLEIYGIPSGTKAFDWTVPKEWNIRDAYVKNFRGEKVIDFKKSNLHIVGYSLPIRKKMPFATLRKHLFTLPEHPDWIPYRYAFYKKTWGFCLSHHDFLRLEDGIYEVCIDSNLEDGRLNYGEFYIKGRKPDEILISCHACHPSLANDNLSGVATATILAKYLQTLSLRYSYRFLFLPATIGAVVWLSKNESHLSRIRHGVVLTGLGDPGKSTYKKSRRGNAEVDRAFLHSLKHAGEDFEIMEFSPYGYDERQFCSPGFNLPVGVLMRTPYDRYPEYHTSADNPDFVRPAFLADSFFKCLSALNILENNKAYLNLKPRCEPQLGRRGLYRDLAGQKETPLLELALLWVLNFSDGSHTLLDIAEKSGLAFDTINTAAEALEKKGLLKEMS